jgi:hypothetical protein
MLAQDPVTGQLYEVPDNQPHGGYGRAQMMMYDGLGNPVGLVQLAHFGRPFTEFIADVAPGTYAAGTVAQRAGMPGLGEVGRGTMGLTADERRKVRFEIKSRSDIRFSRGAGHALGAALADRVFCERYPERCPRRDFQTPQNCNQLKSGESEALKAEWNSIWHEVTREYLRVSRGL